MIQMYFGSKHVVFYSGWCSLPFRIDFTRGFAVHSRAKAYSAENLNRIVEVNLAITVACAPCFPAFFTKARVMSSSLVSFLAARLGTSSRTSSGYRRSSGADESSLKRKLWPVGESPNSENTDEMKGGVMLESRIVRGFGRLKVTDSGNVDLTHSQEDEIDHLRKATPRQNMESVIESRN